MQIQQMQKMQKQGQGSGRRAVAQQHTSAGMCCAWHAQPSNTVSPWESTPAAATCALQGFRQAKQGAGVVTCSLPPSSSPGLPEKPAAHLAVFVSGGGSNMKAIHAAILEGHVNASIVAVVSDVPSCGGVSYARQHNIPVLTYPAPKKGDWPGLTSQELAHALKVEYKVDFVLLAGYLKLIPAELVKAFPRAMLNIHPGLLPSFGGKGMYGERVHNAVLKSGARFTGPTVHFVDEEFDTGAILAQRVVPVFPTDTAKQIAARVLKEEWQVYPSAVAALVDGRITWREDGVPIIWTGH